MLLSVINPSPDLKYHARCLRRAQQQTTGERVSWRESLGMDSGGILHMEDCTPMENTESLFKPTAAFKMTPDERQGGC